jgi:hypothetical protein
MVSRIPTLVDRDHERITVVAWIPDLVDSVV